MSENADGMLDEVDAICDRFEDAWKSGDPPDLRAYLESAPERIRNALFKELVAIDAHYKQRRGMPRSRQSYDREFPEYCDTMLMTAPTRARLSSGEMVDKYRIVEFVDQGAQAEVYLAEHQTLNRTVIIKLWNGDQFDDPETAEAVVHEGRLLVKLRRHPSLPQVYDCNIFDGRPYLVFEYVNAVTLKKWLNIQHPTLGARIAVMRQIAAATAWLHQQDVVHQDLKPGNILVCPLGDTGNSAAVQVKLIDFGLATWHSVWSSGPTEQVAGTPGYMAPEIAQYFVSHAATSADSHAVLNGLDVNLRLADVFSLGCVLYYLLTDKSPFRAIDGESRLDYITRCARCEYDAEPLKQLRRGRRYAGLCQRALSLNPQDRPSAAQFLRELRLIQSVPRLAGIGAAAVLLLIGALTLFYSQPSPLAPVATVEHVYRDQIDPNRPFQLSSDLVPLYPGHDKLSLEWNIPARHASACFLISPAGDIRLLEEWASTSDPRRRRVSTQSISDPGPGTVGVFVCTIRGAQIPRKAIQDAWMAAESNTPATPGEKWPALPNVLLRISDSGVREDLGAPPRDAGSEKAFYAVRDRLNTFRVELRLRSMAIDGIAFPQAEGQN